MFVEEKMIGHFLRSIFGAPTTQTVVASTSYRHVFEVSNSPKTYTIDLQRADAPWVHRYFGVFFTTMEFKKEDNGIQVTITCMPRKVFQNARVTTAASSGTTLLMDQTAGIHADDTILVLDKADGFTTIATLTVTTVDSATQLTVSTIGVQWDVNDIVVISADTVVDSDYVQKLVNAGSRAEPTAICNSVVVFVALACAPARVSIASAAFPALICPT